MARKQQGKRQPPVSLSPLTPEDALAGLLKVKPEKEEGMPKISELWGILVSVDTDDHQMVVAVKTVPPEPQTHEETYEYRLPGWTEEMFTEAVGFPVRLLIEDTIVVQLRLA